MSKPAFPRPFSEPHANVEDDYFAVTPSQEGMSLLEYYAGQSNVPWEEAAHSFEKARGKKPTIMDVIEARVQISFDYAEAMVKEAEKRSKQ